MRHKYYIFIVLLLLITGITANTVYAQNDTVFHLRNAYELAKWLSICKKQSRPVSDTEKQQLLGGLISYANIEDDSSFFFYDSLFNKLRKYATTFNIAKSIFDGLALPEKFFDLPDGDKVNNTLSNPTVTISDSIRRQISN